MATGTTALGTWRVLVVDDEQNLNWSLVNSLRKDGYVSDGALTGSEAQRLLQEGYYDCVISDVKMPGLDGFELLQWLRQHRPKTRVIMMTAFGSPTAREEALRSGVVAYLEKPFDLRALKEELQRLAAAERAERAAQGEGESYDLLEVARVINLSRRDIALSVRSNGHAGVLHFVRGELIWAETNGLRGDEAFLMLSAARGAQIQPMAWDGRTDRNVSQPLSRLLYMALAQREGRSAPGTRPLHPLAGVAPGVAPSGPASADHATVTAAPTVEMPAAPRADGPASAITTGALQPVTSVGNGVPSTPPATGPLMPPPAGDAALVGALAALGSELPAPNVVALLRTDGGVLAHAERDTGLLPAGAYTHLSTTALAAARALLVADLGVLDEVRITTSDHLLLLRRVAHAERTALLALVLPRDAVYSSIIASVQAHTVTILDAVR